MDFAPRECSAVPSANQPCSFSSWPKPDMGSVRYSDPTRAVLESSRLTADNVWHLQECELGALEASFPGIREAWLEVRRRPQPVPPFVGSIFGKKPPQPRPEAPPRPPRLSEQPAKRRRAWSGLPEQARDPGSLVSDADKRRRAAMSALELASARMARGQSSPGAHSHVGACAPAVRGEIRRAVRQGSVCGLPHQLVSSRQALVPTEGH